MGTHNPYDDYDAFDPWDEEDDTGNFEFVEDEYDSMGSLEDNIPQIGDTAPEVILPGGTESFPPTMLRQTPVSQPTPAPQPQTPPKGGGILHRRSRQKRRDKNRGYAPAPAPYVEGYDPYPGAAQPVQPAPKRRRRRRHRHHGCLVTLLMFVALTVGVYWVVAHPIDEKLAFTPAEQETVGNSLSWSVPGMPYYALVLGSDAREGVQGNRTDTMVLIRIDLIGGKLTMLSIPRDTKIELEGHGTQKINAAYAFEGVGGSVRAVSELCGVPISHVAIIKFEELVGLVDYLGGVTVNVPTSLNDPMTGLVLDAGVQTMDGTTALLWARSRYGYERGDFERQDNQRLLMTAVMNRMLSLSPKEIPGALEHIGDFVGTDLRCYNLLPLMLRFKLASPTVYSASVPSTTAMIDGVSYVLADEAQLAQMMQVIRAGGDPSSV